MGLYALVSAPAVWVCAAGILENLEAGYCVGCVKEETNEGVSENELRLTRKLLLIWMGIVLILCGFAYFEYLSLKESLNELTGLISNFPKILKAMFGVSGDLTSALGWYGCMYYWVTMLTNSYAVYLGVSCVAKEQAQGTAEYLFTKPVGRNKVVCAKAVACVCNLLALAVFSGLCNYFTAILPLGGLEQRNAAFTTTLGLF